MSEDHKPDNRYEKSRILNAGGEVFGGRINEILNLSRAIGDFEFKNNKNLRPEEQMVSVEPDI